jgi:hypothetical protein
MRVLQLRKFGMTLDLHPFVSVVYGLDEETRAQVIDALAAVPAGDDPGLAGLVEAHGLLLDLTPSVLRLLDMRAPLDVVVRRENLPGVPSPAKGRDDDGPPPEEVRVATRRREAEEAAAAMAAAVAAHEAGSAPTDLPSIDAQLQRRVQERRADREQAASAHAAAEAALEASRTRLAAAADTADAQRRTLDELREQRRAAAERCSLSAAELEAARSARDPFAGSTLAAAQEHLAELEAEAARVAAEEARAAEAAEAAAVGHEAAADDEASRTGFTGSAEELAASIDELRRRRTEVAAALVAAEAGDRYVVEVAIAELRAAPPTELVPSSDAVALADEWQRIDHQLDALSGAGNSGADAAAARQRLEAARAGLIDAEQAVRPPELDRTSVEELEQAHAEVLDAQDKVDSRFGGKRAQRRLDELRVAEQAVLDRIGFNTYADFMMGTSIFHVDADAEHNLEAARVRLAEAEDAWAALEADVDAELTRAQLLERRRELREKARVMLGDDPGEDVVGALRRHRVVAAAIDDRAMHLQEALLRAGLALGDELLSADELNTLAEVWLAEEGESAAHRTPLEHELGDLEARLAQLEDVQHELDAGARAGAANDAADRERRRQARLDEARAAVVAALARVARNADAETEVVARTEAFDVATEAERAAGDRAIAAEARMIASDDEERKASAEVQQATAAVEDTAAALEVAEQDLALAEAALGAARTAVAERESGIGALERAVAETTAVHRAAQAALAEAEAELAAVEAARASNEFAPPAPRIDVDEVEWYLLARLAAQRAVSYAGSVPLVLDEALADLDDNDTRRVLRRLERMAASVQVVFVSEDPAVAQWALEAGPDRAALVTAGN